MTSHIEKSFLVPCMWIQRNCIIVIQVKGTMLGHETFHRTAAYFSGQFDQLTKMAEIDQKLARNGINDKKIDHFSWTAIEPHYNWIIFGIVL